MSQRAWIWHSSLLCAVILAEQPPTTTTTATTTTRPAIFEICKCVTLCKQGARCCHQSPPKAGGEQICSCQYSLLNWFRMRRTPALPASSHWCTVQQHELQQLRADTLSLHYSVLFFSYVTGNKQVVLLVGMRVLTENTWYACSSYSSVSCAFMCTYFSVERQKKKMFWIILQQVFKH